jgi:hypothetical protein
MINCCHSRHSCLIERTTYYPKAEIYIIVVLRLIAEAFLVAGLGGEYLTTMSRYEYTCSGI